MATVLYASFLHPRVYVQEITDMNLSWNQKVSKSNYKNAMAKNARRKKIFLVWQPVRELISTSRSLDLNKPKLWIYVVFDDF